MSPILTILSVGFIPTASTLWLKHESVYSQNKKQRPKSTWHIPRQLALALFQTKHSKSGYNFFSCIRWIQFIQRCLKKHVFLTCDQSKTLTNSLCRRTSVKFCDSRGTRWDTELPQIKVPSQISVFYSCWGQICSHISEHSRNLTLKFCVKINGNGIAILVPV